MTYKSISYSIEYMTKKGQSKLKKYLNTLKLFQSLTYSEICTLLCIRNWVRVPTQAPNVKTMNIGVTL